MNTAVIFWSGTGNTEAMAQAVAEGAGTDAVEVSAFSADLADFDAIAFGCPAMGDEVLEEDTFGPFFADNLSKLSGKKIALFGSYGWGDGQWMRDWEARVKEAGAELVADGLTVNEAPDDDALAQCKELGAKLAG